MESSTSIVPIYRTLREKGYTILVSHPKKTRLIAESRIKTDRVDSWAVTLIGASASSRLLVVE
jgi:hypothetical protein